MEPLVLAPEWETVAWFNTDRPVSLASLRGRVVMVHAFQMLCPGCVARGIPQAQRVAQAFAGAPLTVVGLHTVFEHHAAMQPHALEAFLHEYRVRFPVGVDAPGESGDPTPHTMRAYGMRGTPTTVLIDGEGRIRRTLENLARLALPALGDYGFFDVVQGDGTVRRVARAHQDESMETFLRQTSWQRSERGDMNLCALSSGRTAHHPFIDDAWYRRAATSPEHLEVLRMLAFRSMLSVPLVYRGRLLGALTLFFARSARRHTPAEVELAEELAGRAAAALENARLYGELQSTLHAQREGDRRKDEFLAMLAHELRNPLAPLMTVIDLLKSRGESLRECAVADRQLRHLVRLVDDLLDISRVTQGKITLRAGRVSLAEIVTKAVELARPLITERSHRLEVAVPEEPIELFADQERLAQALSNLLHNAAKYTDPGGCIWVEVERLPSEVAVTVEDDGIGIRPELLPRIFDVFVQDARSIDRSKGGLGVGLTLVKTIAELHGGSIVATSAGIGKGSRFTIRIPTSRIETARTSAEHLVAPAPSRKRRVLAVDDNVDAVELLAEALRRAGHEVAVAYSSREALARAGDAWPDVALLDLGLPDVDGFELAPRLRSMRGSSPLRLVALSGYGRIQDRDESRSAGFDAHLVKPVTIDEVIHVIEAEELESSPVDPSSLAPA